MSKVVTKTDLINKLAEELNITKALAGKATNTLISDIKESLGNGDDVQLMGFGSFTTANRAARMGRNPQTGKPLKIPAKIVPKFKAGKALKEAVD